MFLDAEVALTSDSFGHVTTETRTVVDILGPSNVSRTVEAILDDGTKLLNLGPLGWSRWNGASPMAPLTSIRVNFDAE
mgnify:CR=1 FL=1